MGREGAALRGRSTGTQLIDGQPVSLGHLQVWALGAHSKYILQWDSGLSWQVLGAEPGQSLEPGRKSPSELSGCSSPYFLRSVSCWRDSCF